MIIREASADDAAALESFHVGDLSSVWLAEVAEIVGGLIVWQRDIGHAALDRRVVVLEIDGDIVAVCAHERIEHVSAGPLDDHRYVMVVAVRAARQRTGVATLLFESVLADMQQRGVLTASWLVHPRNLGSILFARARFPEADETYPPEDHPYVRFELRL